MNLIGHIPGVGPTALFNPGASTPVPWNIAHTGATDGAGPATATKNMAEIYNRLLLQIAATVQQAGLAIDNNNWAQLPAAIVAIAQSELAAAAIPAGDIHLFARNTPPTGYLKANGALVSRVTYATLFAAIGVTFGVGDGVNTFGLPDLRGEFLRGWDDARGADSGRVFGSFQSDDNKAHIHGGVQVGMAGNNGGTGPGTTEIATMGSTSSTGGTEARPRNVALLACIKF